MCEGDKRAAALTVYTPDEVKKHCFQHDCWVIIDNKVYDVTSYIPRHPGGALIYVKAGGDCTQLFESYHVATHRARYATPTASQRIVIAIAALNPRRPACLWVDPTWSILQGSTAEVLHRRAGATSWVFRHPL